MNYARSSPVHCGPLPSILCVLILAVFFCGCHSAVQDIPSPWLEFCCRDEGRPAERIPLYRARVPLNWEQQPVDPNESIQDSRRPNVEFHIHSASKPPLHLTVHTFPVDTFAQRVPPEAQISRWKRQFDELDVTSVAIEPRARAGFEGLSFYAEGSINGTPHAILGFSMGLAPSHWFILQPNEKALFKNKQMAASYTIKVVGAPRTIQELRKEIEHFANSFELIEEIPSR